MSKSVKLTKAEQLENYNITIGRLRAVLKKNKQLRELNLLDKITRDTNKMEIELMHAQNELDGKYDTNTYIN